VVVHTSDEPLACVVVTDLELSAFSTVSTVTFVTVSVSVQVFCQAGVTTVAQDVCFGGTLELDVPLPSVLVVVVTVVPAVASVVVHVSEPVEVVFTQFVTAPLVASVVLVVTVPAAGSDVVTTLPSTHTVTLVLCVKVQVLVTLPLASLVVDFVWSVPVSVSVVVPSLFDTVHVVVPATASTTQFDCPPERGGGGGGGGVVVQVGAAVSLLSQ
jgi:hypothetical protein